MIPITAEVLFSLYGSYNQAIGLAPFIGYVLCVSAVLLALRPVPNGGRLVAAILASFWIWTGAVFHIGFFGPLNWGALIFGAFFILEGLALAWSGIAAGRLDFHWRPGVRGAFALCLLAFALAYPLLDLLAGQMWPRLQLPGTLPAPTVLATLGLLLLTPGRTAFPFMLIPLLWALIGGAAAAALGIWQDVAMAIAAFACVPVFFLGRDVERDAEKCARFSARIPL